MNAVESLWTRVMLRLGDRAPAVAANLKYARYLFFHKLYVYRAGRDLGLTRLRLLIHDWHKMLPDEWAPYREKFYGSFEFEWAPEDPDVQAGLYRAYEQAVDAGFSLAWNRHQKRARHHWQHWVMLEDDGDLKLLPIPRVYVLEMLADWKGAGKAITGRDDVKEWYLKTRRHRLLHPYAQAMIEGILEIPATVQQSRRLTEVGPHDAEVLSNLSFRGEPNRQAYRDTPGLELPPPGMYRCEDCGEIEWIGNRSVHRHRNVPVVE